MPVRSPRSSRSWPRHRLRMSPGLAGRWTAGCSRWARRPDRTWRTTTGGASDHEELGGGGRRGRVAGLIRSRGRGGLALAASSGFAGTPSDGLVQLDAHRKLVSQYRTASDGNVVQTAEVAATPGQPFTLALGFGADAAAAVGVARASASTPFVSMMDGYVSGWRAYDRTLRRPPASVSSLTRARYWLSANVIKADEDKTYPGAFVASPTDPWGQSVPATTTHPGWTYRSVFARDGYETFTGLLADGDLPDARAMVRFLFGRAQQPDGSFPRDSLIDG